MVNPRQRSVIVAFVSAAVVLLLAWGGYALAGHMKITGEKVRAYLHEVELSKLSGEARAKALRRLAEMMNALTGEERRIARLDKEWAKWFESMTDQEKLDYLDTTLPSGFKEMLGAFEQLSPEQRRRAVDDAMRRMKEAQGNPAFAADGGPTVQLSPEMQKKATAMGLQAFYSQSSAQTKAEMAPLLEEIQKSMESGRLFRSKR
jgi:hypothetical protein